MELTGQAPNIDFALGAATTALGLPPGSALAIFLVARSVGWIAHAMEQYETGVLIRPRARYTGRRAG
jgi:citrate synthase